MFKEFAEVGIQKADAFRHGLGSTLLILPANGYNLAPVRGNLLRISFLLYLTNGYYLAPEYSFCKARCLLSQLGLLSGASSRFDFLDVIGHLDESPTL